jgi:hypothetical protein
MRVNYVLLTTDTEIEMNIVEKYEPREYCLMSHNGGIVLCDKKEGAFLVLRFKEDVERLKDLLSSIEIKALL